MHSKAISVLLGEAITLINDDSIIHNSSLVKASLPLFIFSQIILKVIIADNLNLFSFDSHPLHKIGINSGHSF